MNALFAVIDTETTWSDEVMSIGIVLSNFEDFQIIDKIYYIITPEYKYQGMYSLALKQTRGAKYKIDTRVNALKEINNILLKKNVKYIFAYNASFDFRHLPELSSFIWYDIMKIAAYKQYNEFLPKNADYCKNGRLKSGFGVEQMYTYLSKKYYTEVHNALCDAEDELMIMKMLNKQLDDYHFAIINSNEPIVTKESNKSINKNEPHNIESNESAISSNKKEEEIIYIKAEINTISIGDEIIHENLGKGTIMEINNEYITIRFESFDKKINLAHACENGYLLKKNN